MDREDFVTTQTGVGSMSGDYHVDGSIGFQLAAMSTSPLPGVSDSHGTPAPQKTLCLRMNNAEDLESEKEQNEKQGWRPGRL